ncbi:MAG: acyltransferase [Acidimicrobiales bacterium]|nr:acyltransferase [Acidimicrobiales bacterium]
MHVAREPEDARPTVPGFSYVPALDGLRGVAIGLVVFRHLETVEAGDVLLQEGYLPGGFLGVDLFFVLSGFLITTLLLREVSDGGTVHLGAFYARRALRLLPALYLFLAAHLLYAVLADLSLAHELRSLASATLYVSNWQTVHNLFTVNEGLGHLWSLAVEEQFYVLWPLALLGLLRLDRSGRLLRGVLVAAIVAICLHRAILWEGGGDWLFLYIRTDTRLDTLLVGALLAVAWAPTARLPARLAVPLGWLGAGVLAVIVLVGRPREGFVYLVGFPLFALASAAVVLAIVDTDRGVARLLAAAPLRAVGRVSYGLYLWHPLAFLIIHRWAPDGTPVPVRVAVGLALAAATTALSYRLVERPALELKARIRPGRRRRAAVG